MAMGRQPSLTIKDNGQPSLTIEDKGVQGWHSETGWAVESFSRALTSLFFPVLPKISSEGAAQRALAGSLPWHLGLCLHLFLTVTSPPSAALSLLSEGSGLALPLMHLAAPSLFCPSCAPHNLVGYTPIIKASTH